MSTAETTKFDVIVIGGGHAGIEAAHASAQLGCKTALITLRKDRIGWMPCNPAVGGIGKGHIVFEISALGGLMPQLCSQSYLQAKMLNTRKGPAVQGLRLQIDKAQYAQASQEILQKTSHLTIIEKMVDEVLLDENKQVTGVLTADGLRYSAQAAILTTGTFLNGRIHLGQENWPAGRKDEDAVIKLAEFMKSLNLDMGRLKTGTPPRLLASSIDTSKMEEDISDQVDYLFEFEPQKAHHKRACYITRTNKQAHDLIFENAHLSPVLTKKVAGTAPRYCPSIEDKVTRFAHKDSHHIFVEPEGLESNEVYPNGISTCLPKEAQEKFIRSIKGFENAIITNYGYAIEYDYVLPNQLHHSLELKTVPGFFLAGQINGTTGYEEAAGQGLIAGINAARKTQGKAPFVMNRTQGYIGIMIDDLVTFGVSEPYRMFTSRAERRLILRQDNVFTRLGETAYHLGLISQERYNAIIQEKERTEKVYKELEERKETKRLIQLVSAGEAPKVKAFLKDFAPHLNPRELTHVYAEVLYAPYKARELREIERHAKYREMFISKKVSYKDMPGLSRELQEKLIEHQPQTVAQAAMIQGMTPAAISLLIFKIRELNGEIKQSIKNK